MKPATTSPACRHLMLPVLPPCWPSKSRRQEMVYPRTFYTDLNSLFRRIGAVGRPAQNVQVLPARQPCRDMAFTSRHSRSRALRGGMLPARPDGLISVGGASCYASEAAVRLQRWAFFGMSQATGHGAEIHASIGSKFRL
jgi:hypothetical protein